MTITTATISTWFKKFNKEYWNGSLPTPAFKVSKSSYRVLGRHTCKTGFIKSFDHTIIIYNYYDRTEHCFQETLLHEMCHLYVAVKYNKGGHGIEWKREAARINQYGWNISRCANLEEEGVKRVESVRAKNGDRLVAVISLNSTTRFVCCLKEDYKTKLEEAFKTKNPKFYHMKNVEFFQNYSTTGRGNSLRGCRCSVSSKKYKDIMAALVA